MSLNINQHRTIMVRILKNTFENPILSTNLGFKGGTALYLFYDLNRFSVDLDFDLIHTDKSPDVFREMENLLTNFGKLKEKIEKRYTIFFLLQNENKDLGVANIKIEINKRDFGSKYEAKNLLGFVSKVMTLEDMFANKLVAFYERNGVASRDIFDMYYFLERQIIPNAKIINLRTGLEIDVFLKRCVKILKEINNKRILSGLGELIDDKQKNWVRESLLSEVTLMLNLRLGGKT